MQAKNQIMQYYEKYDLKDSVSLIIIFILTRIIFYIFGIRFQDASLYGYWQYIDIDLLRNNLIQSLFYLHSQPPLFNMYLGIIAKIFKSDMNLGFEISFMLAGLMLTLSMFNLMRNMGVERKLSFVLTFLFIISPSAILYENHLIYTYFVAALLITASFFLFRFLKYENTWDCFFLFALLASIILIRPTYQLIWLGLIVFILFSYKKSCRKKIIYAALPIILLILILYLKNYYLFGLLGTTSWTGFFISGTTTNSISIFDRSELYEDGIISDVSMIPPFPNNIDVYFYEPIINIEDLRWIDVEKEELAIPERLNGSHLQLIMNISGIKPTKISSIDISIPEGGRWSSYNSGCWILNVFYNYSMLNPDYIDSLGYFSGMVKLDLYGRDLGSRRSDKYAVMIRFNDVEQFSQAVYTNDTNAAKLQINKRRFIPITIINTGIPVLDQKRKSIGGPNFNNINMINISKIYMSDGMHVVLYKPMVFFTAYLNAIYRGVKSFFKPSSYFFEYDTPSNLNKIKYLNDFYNFIFYGKLSSGFGLILALIYFVVIIYGIHSIYLVINKTTSNWDLDIAITIMTVHILYVSLICILVGPGIWDQSRYRFEIDPIALVIVGLVMNRFKSFKI